MTVGVTDHLSIGVPNLHTLSSNPSGFSLLFSIDSIVLPRCTAMESKHMYGNFASAAQFYVFVGVLTMLFCVAMGVYYVYFHDRYFTDSRFSKYVSSIHHSTYIIGIHLLDCHCSVMVYRLMCMGR